MKTKGQEGSSSKNVYISLSTMVRDLQRLMHEGYTHFELRDANIIHPVHGVEPAKGRIFPDNL